jgi:hypothetical protein
MTVTLGYTSTITSPQNVILEFFTTAPKLQKMMVSADSACDDLLSATHHQFEILALGFCIDWLQVTGSVERPVGPIFEGPFNKGVIRCPERSGTKR